MMDEATRKLLDGAIVKMEAAEAARESQAKDAERYRKLRDKAPAGWYVGPDIEVDEAGGVHGYSNHSGGDLDAAVDAWPAVGAA